jgi:hypothetical protein
MQAQHAVRQHVLGVGVVRYIEPVYFARDRQEPFLGSEECHGREAFVEREEDEEGFTDEGDLERCEVHAEIVRQPSGRRKILQAPFFGV